MNSNGAGSGNVTFTPFSTDDVPGVRLTAKVCELCGKNFFRDAAKLPPDRECAQCAARLAAVKEKQEQPFRMRPEIEVREDTRQHMREAWELRRKAREDKAALAKQRRAAREHVKEMPQPKVYLQRYWAERAAKTTTIQ